MIFIGKLISNLQLHLVFLYAISAILQVIGICVLYLTKHLHGSQRIILINISICHLSFSICSIFKLSIIVTNFEAPHLMKFALYFVKRIPGVIYPLLMH